jgi:hypothetical protein
MTNSPTFHVTNERTKQAKSLLAIFLGLLERTIKQRVMFMVKAKAEGKARMFMELITSKRLIAHDCGHNRIDTISYVKKGQRSTPRPSPIITARSIRYHPESP